MTSSVKPYKYRKNHRVTATDTCVENYVKFTLSLDERFLRCPNWQTGSKVGLNLLNALCRKTKTLQLIMTIISMVVTSN